MPEIEVAGLLLRVLPILFSAVDFSKDGFCRAGAAIRKRKYVEKLVCALLLQQSITQETVKSVLIASRHKDIYRLEDDSLEYLKAESVRDEVMDYLGPKNDAAFTGNLERCHDIAKRIAKNLADLVPTFKVCFTTIID